MKNKNSKKGFTLIELMVVVILIGVLSAIAIPSYFSNLETAKAREALDFIRHWQTARSLYAADTGNMPENKRESVPLLGLDSIMHHTSSGETSNFNHFDVCFSGDNSATCPDNGDPSVTLTRSNNLYAIFGTDNDIYCCYTAGDDRSEKVCRTLADSASQNEQGGILPSGRTCLKLGVND